MQLPAVPGGEEEPEKVKIWGESKSCKSRGGKMQSSFKWHPRFCIWKVDQALESVLHFWTENLFWKGHNLDSE